MSKFEVIAFVLLLVCGHGVARSQQAQPIPHGYDFPASQSVLIGFRDSNNLHGMRRHIWNVFAGMTQPTADGEAVWETWYPSKATFGGLAAAHVQLGRSAFTFEEPRQFLKGRNHPEAIGASLASFTLFSKELKDFVQQQGLGTVAKLKKINNSFNSHTPVEQRSIPEFPNKSVAIKTAWWIVKKTGLTAIPVWDPPSDSPSVRNDYRTWQRCVFINPSPSNNSIAQAPKDLSHHGASSVVPLSAFYHFALTAAQAQQLSSLPHEIPNLDTVTEGDYVALIALHFTTKEIPEWVWATFWWHDKPDDGPFARDRTNNVKGVWRNYLMTTSYSMDMPREPDGSPHIAFNPWLEGTLDHGVQSNCMTCHRRAVYSGSIADISGFLVTRGTPAPDDPRFAGATKLDFLWSIRLESH